MINVLTPAPHSPSKPLPRRGPRLNLRMKSISLDSPEGASDSLQQLSAIERRRVSGYAAAWHRKLISSQSQGRIMVPPGPPGPGPGPGAGPGIAPGSSSASLASSRHSSRERLMQQDQQCNSCPTAKKPLRARSQHQILITYSIRSAPSFTFVRSYVLQQT